MTFSVGKFYKLYFPNYFQSDTYSYKSYLYLHYHVSIQEDIWKISYPHIIYIPKVFHQRCSRLQTEMNIFCFFETGFLCAALVVLYLDLQRRLTLNKRSAYFCLPSARIKGIHHHIRLGTEHLKSLIITDRSFFSKSTIKTTTTTCFIAPELLPRSYFQT